MKSELKTCLGVHGVPVVLFLIPRILPPPRVHFPEEVVKIGTSRLTTTSDFETNTVATVVEGERTARAAHPPHRPPPPRPPHRRPRPSNNVRPEISRLSIRPAFATGASSVGVSPRPRRHQRGRGFRGPPFMPGASDIPAALAASTAEDLSNEVGEIGSLTAVGA